MGTSRRHRWRGGWISRALAAVLLVLIPLWEPWPQGKEPTAGNLGEKPLDKQLHIAVQQGRLSVEFIEADIREVLAQIGQQAGIPIFFGPSSGNMVSADFADVELEKGLHRLLRLASLSYMILYARESSGLGAIQAVHVLGEERDGPPAQLIVVERDVKGSRRQSLQIA